MKLMTIIRKIDTFLQADDERGMIDWFRQNLRKHPDNLDLSYWFQEALACYDHDVELANREPCLLQQCTAVIKDRKNKEPVEVAKAYAYRSEMRYYKVDRVKDFDKAIDILNGISHPEKDVVFIREFIAELYEQHIRRMFQFYTNARNMFIIR